MTRQQHGIVENCDYPDTVQTINNGSPISGSPISTFAKIIGCPSTAGPSKTEGFKGLVRIEPTESPETTRLPLNQLVDFNYVATLSSPQLQGPHVFVPVLHQMACFQADAPTDRKSAYPPPLQNCHSRVQDTDSSSRITLSPLSNRVEFYVTSEFGPLT